MLSERDVYLEKDNKDKGNGFYDRTLATSIGKLELSVPRTRNGDFRPKVLPEPYKREEKSYTDLLMSLVINGYSEFSLLNTLKSFNLPYSQEELNKIKDELKDKLELFKSRELLEDAYQCDIREGLKVKKATCYIVLGIYTFFGKESRDVWNMVFVHLQRNVRRHMNQIDSTQFNRELSKLRSESSLEEAKEKFILLFEGYKNKYSRFINNIMQKAEHYLIFTKYPYEIRKHIYTTNSVESVNSIIERILQFN
jgi:putative transposase